MDDDRSVGAGAAIAIIATITVGASLILIREHVNNSVVALLLAAVVVLSGSLGGRRAGVASALAAAVSFNFFHTRPYLSLRIHDVDDVLTTATLLGVGLVAGLGAQVSGRRRAAADEATQELNAVGRVASLVAGGGDPEDVEIAVRAELLQLLKLADCRFDLDPAAGMVLVDRTGNHPSKVRVFHDGGFELPPAGIAIPVRSDGTTVGHLAAVPQPGTVIPLAARRTAIVLADLLGASRSADARRRHDPTRN